MFFIGYFFFEVPSNLIMYRVGARLWIARIMITWGLLSACFVLVDTPFWFYTLRFLLGAAEAGFYPGVILYLTSWYPDRRRAAIVATFMAAIPIAGIFGNPLSGWIMDAFDQFAGMRGWQWMFLIEAVPAVLLGILVLFFLCEAKWLTGEEKLLLERNIEADAGGKKKSPRSLSGVLKDHRLWMMSAIYFCFCSRRADMRAALLVATNLILAWQRRRSRHRSGQLNRESRRLCESLPYRLSEGCYAEQPHWDVHARGDARARCLAGAEDPSRGCEPLTSTA